MLRLTRSVQTPKSSVTTHNVRLVGKPGFTNVNKPTALRTQVPSRAFRSNRTTFAPFMNKNDEVEINEEELYEMLKVQMATSKTNEMEGMTRSEPKDWEEDMAESRHNKEWQEDFKKKIDRQHKEDILSQEHES